MNSTYAEKKNELKSKTFFFSGNNIIDELGKVFLLAS